VHVCGHTANGAGHVPCWWEWHTDNSSNAGSYLRSMYSCDRSARASVLFAYASEGDQAQA
jgi:hypothetical protein